MLVPCRRLRSPSSAPPPGGAPTGPPSNRGAGVLSLTGRAIPGHLPAGSGAHGEAKSWPASQRYTLVVRASVCPGAGKRSLQDSSIQNGANPRSDEDLQSSVQKHATLEGPKRPCSLSEGVIKSGGELFATEGLRGFKAFRLQSGRAWLFQKLQLSQRKALCNLHQEVCAEGRRRGQGEVAALRRGQSKLLSRKKKSQTKTPDTTALTPPFGLRPRPPRLRFLQPRNPAACLPEAEGAGQLRLDPSRRTTNGTPGSAKAREGAVREVALLFGGRRDADLHLPNGRRH